MFVRFLANSFKSPVTTKNYLSGAKTWVQNHVGNIHAFLSPQIHDMTQAVTKTSLHVPSKAYPLSPCDMSVICAFIQARPWIPLCCKPALLIAYAAFLRSSNFLSPTTSSWGGPHTLRFNDVILTPNGLQLVIRSSKTIRPGPPVLLDICTVHNNDLCPVLAWIHYVSRVSLAPSGPAFVLSLQCPLTARPLVKIMRAALKKSGCVQILSQYIP